MPVKLRLRRQGRRKAPHYAIVAADSRAPRDGRFIQKIGYYDPIAEPGRVYVDHDAALKWLKVGAQPTHTVRSLLRHAGVTLKFALIKQGKSEEEMDRIYGRWRSEKDRKKKKKVIMIDVHGRPLEPIPGAEEKAAKAVKPAPAPAEEEKPAETEAPVEEAAAAVEEAAAETPAEEATPEAEAPAAEEAAPEAEAPAEETAEAPAEEEKPAEEESSSDA